MNSETIISFKMTRLIAWVIGVSGAFIVHAWTHAQLWPTWVGFLSAITWLCLSLLAASFLTHYSHLEKPELYTKLRNPNHVKLPGLSLAYVLSSLTERSPTHSAIGATGLWNDIHRTVKRVGYTKASEDYRLRLTKEFLELLDKRKEEVTSMAEELRQLEKEVYDASAVYSVILLDSREDKNGLLDKLKDVIKAAIILVSLLCAFLVFIAFSALIGVAYRSLVNAFSSGF